MYSGELARNYGYMKNRLLVYGKHKDSYSCLCSDGIHDSGGAQRHSSPPEEIPRRSFLVSSCW